MDVPGTVMGAIDLISKLVDYLQAVRGAKEDRLKLLSEVSGLKTLLEVTRDRLGNIRSDGSGNDISNKVVKVGIESSLDVCRGALQSTVNRLENIALNVPSTGQPFLFVEKMKDLKWPFHQGEIKTLLSSIERLKLLLSLALQTSLIEFIEKARNELEMVGQSVEDVKAAVSFLEANQRVHTKKIESAQDDLISLDARLRGAANGVTDIKNTVDRNQQDQECRDVLNWFSAPDFDQKHTVMSDKHTVSTGEWLLRHPKFVAWQQGKYSVLWCPGDPGVGKSVMSSVVIRHLHEKFSEDTAVVFIYFDYTIHHTTRQLVEALLSQLTRRGLSGSVMESLRRHIKTINHPTLEELWAILEDEVETYTRVFVVIDALDEADISTWAPLIGRLRAFKSRISLIATSRNLPKIMEGLQPSARLDIVADEGDLRKYIKGRISASIGPFKRLLKANASLRTEVIAGVVEKAAGMFLLAWLHMSSLETKTRVVDLRQALNALPGNLTSAYDTTMSRISDEDKPLALRIFSWVAHAAHPMTINDLQYALAVEDGMTTIDTDFLHDQAYLTSICLGLVVLRHDTSYSHHRGHYVGLVHYTAQDYFLCNHVSTKLPHPVHLATTCIRYLSFNFNIPLNTSWVSQRTFVATVPFVEYAATSLAEHVSMHRDDPTVHRLIMELLNDHRRVAIVGFLAGCASAIQLCAHFRLSDHLIYLLDNGFNINSKDSKGNTALMVAAIRGHEEILQLLLTREGIDVNPEDMAGATPLTRAVMHRCPEILELLLARDDVDVNRRDHNGWTPLAHATAYDHSGIVGLLLARGDIKINLSDNYGNTPLALAISLEHEAIVQLLLARGDLGIGLRNKDGNTYLALAAYNNNSRIVKSLLAKGDINVNSRNLEGRAALSVAAYRGNDAVVKVLLAQDGIEINAIDEHGKTALDLAETETPTYVFDSETIERKKVIAELLRAAGCPRGRGLPEPGLCFDWGRLGV